MKNLKVYILTALAAMVVTIVPLYAFAGAGGFDVSVKDIGLVAEGAQVSFEVKMKNTTNMFLTIKELDTSCGCTVVNAPTEPIPPGNIAKITGTIDTSGKMGNMSKTITIYTNELPFPHMLTIIGEVKHFGDGLPDTSLVFKGDCASCHVGKNIEKKQGERLYNAVCQMCHKAGIKAEAALSPKLTNTITNGIAGFSMPGYGMDAGGPLTTEQIDGLTEYIKQRFQ